MSEPTQEGMRALVLGAETPAGQALARALAEAGARLALVAARGDPAVAFETKRLARRSGGAVSQAIDASNEMAVRVMTRQVSKGLGGLDALLFCADLGDRTAEAVALATRFAAREMARSGDGGIVAVLAPLARDLEAHRARVVSFEVPSQPDEEWARGVVRTIAE